MNNKDDKHYFDLYDINDLSEEFLKEVDSMYKFIAV